VEDPKPRADIPRGEKIVEQNTNGDEAIAEFPLQEDRANAKREDVEVDKRNRENEMVRIRDRANRSQDQHERQPRRSI